MRYGIHWDIVAAIPLILGLLFADHLGHMRKKRKAAEKTTMKKADNAAEANAANVPDNRKLVVRKRKSGFRNMKSNAQRIRERTFRQEQAAAAAGIEIEELHEAMEKYAASLRPHQMYKSKP